MKIPKEEALKLFRKIREDGCWPTLHFQLKAQERDFMMEDVFEVAENCVIAKNSPKYNSEHDDHTYTVSGRDIDGIWITIVFSVLSDRTVKLITGYKGYKKRKR